ncbi:MAG: hypothetical protein A2Y78_00125 [Acidobacteria bacterium RBG_13_68_16]|nr:MAG: hypothetical protein A2Y78_00125 [Acidobacteria bacterium RBG_13_68_16]
MQLTGPPPPPAWRLEAPEDRRARLQYRAALWAPTAAMLAVLVPALLGVWTSCASVPRDVAAMRGGVEAMSRDLASLRDRVRDAETAAGAARRESGEALAKARAVEVTVDSHHPSD